MTAEDILKLRDLGEVCKVQFKERILDAYDIGSELVAMSNSPMQHIYITDYQ